MVFNNVMDLLWLVAGLLIAFGGGLAGGFIARMFVDGHGFARLEDEITSLRNTIRANKSVSAAEFRSAEKAARIGEAVQEYLALKEQGLEDKQILAKLAPKYLDLLPDVLKSLGISGNKGFGGLGMLGGLFK